MEDDGDSTAVGAGIVAGALAFGAGLWLARKAVHRVITGGALFDNALALAKKWGGVFGVAPLDIMSIAGIESSYNPNTVNQNERAAPVGGAWGMMQILPGTAAGLVTMIRAHYAASPEVSSALSAYNSSDPHSLLVPDLNVMLGTYYLKRLQDEFGDFDKVAMAYQQGPGRVRSGNVGPLGEQYAEMALARRTRLAEEGVVT